MRPAKRDSTRLFRNLIIDETWGSRFYQTRSTGQRSNGSSEREGVNLFHHRALDRGDLEKTLLTTPPTGGDLERTLLTTPRPAEDWTPEASREALVTFSSNPPGAVVMRSTPAPTRCGSRPLENGERFGLNKEESKAFRFSPKARESAIDVKAEDAEGKAVQGDVDMGIGPRLGRSRRPGRQSRVPLCAPLFLTFVL